MENQTGRNSLDVIMELVHLHFKEAYKSGEATTKEDVEKVYLKYHELVKNNR